MMSKNCEIEKKFGYFSSASFSISDIATDPTDMYKIIEFGRNPLHSIPKMDYLDWLSTFAPLCQLEDNFFSSHFDWGFNSFSARRRQSYQFFCFEVILGMMNDTSDVAIFWYMTALTRFIVHCEDFMSYKRNTKWQWRVELGLEYVQGWKCQWHMGVMFCKITTLKIFAWSLASSPKPELRSAHHQPFIHEPMNLCILGFTHHLLHFRPWPLHTQWEMMLHFQF